MPRNSPARPSLTCLATVAIARWEGKFDDERARVYGTPEEAQYDLKAGEPAFAQSATEHA